MTIDDDLPQPRVDTLRLVLTTTSSHRYHLDARCAAYLEDRSELPAGTRAGFVEAVLAVHYGRTPCAACAAEFGAELAASLPTRRTPVRVDPRQLPVLSRTTRTPVSSLPAAVVPPAVSQLPVSDSSWDDAAWSA